MIWGGLKPTHHNKMVGLYRALSEHTFDIPRNWIWVELGKIGRWQSGSTPNRLNKAYYGGNIPWLKTGDLNDGYITHIPEYITEKL